MDGRERIFRIINRQDVDRSGFWLGNPTSEALAKYKWAFKTFSLEGLSKKMKDDMAWIAADCYKDPLGRPMWDTLGGKKQESLSQIGVFGETENIDDIINFKNWPNPKYMNYSFAEHKLVKARKRGVATFSGMWACIWHLLMDFFGMEECFIKMFTHPEQIHAVMNKMTDFYLVCNKELFERCGDLIDVMFFGNDMGSQLDCLISPEMFREFIFPYYKKLIDQAKGYGKKISLHSCGAIDKIIPDIINMGVDILHPIQAKATNMDAEHLQATYGGQIIFLGGVDTQDILPYGTVEDVEKEVLRIRGIFGKHFICSPSHEALLKNVSPEKLLIMSKTATKLL